MGALLDIDAEMAPLAFVEIVEAGSQAEQEEDQ